MLAPSRSTIHRLPIAPIGHLHGFFESARDCMDTVQRIAITRGAPAAAGAVLAPIACATASIGMALYLPTYVWGLATVGLLYVAVVPTDDSARGPSKTFGLPRASILGMRAGLSVEKGIKNLFLPR